MSLLLGFLPLSAADATSEMAELKKMLLDQQQQINELRRSLAQVTAGNAAPAGTVSAAALAPAVAFIPAVAVAGAQTAPAAPAGSTVQAADIPHRLDTIETALRGLGGFQFSGDFRYRFDLQARSGNDVAAPLQNVRNRYRVRLNVDKALNSQFKVHVQLSTGPASNEITNDQDFAALGVKAPIAISEAWASYTPNRHFAFRAGRMEETFADNSRFLWDDDLRLNGFEEVIRTSLGKTRGFNSIEFRAGEYILTNPNVAVLASSSAFTTAGYTTGTRIGAANLFHPGVVLKGALSENWSQQITGDMSIYRNANQIQLASTTAGFPLVINPALGVTLPSPIGGTGNATTTSGGAIYTAADFKIARLAYRVDGKSALKLGGRQLPGYLDFQVSRNVGAGKLRDAMMATASLGSARKFGEVRGLYSFAIKDANSMISQFTDDDMGTGSGVNIAVHAFRVDVGLTRFLQWQNLFFIQHEKSVSNPGELFFVPLQRGANSTFRYLGQLAFTF